ncbi:hypothetical protein P3X46_004015 [Hevea brasiliensis]|uniref:Uncharacterized protein n=1 Tax=Hevea brasiliensis TaxID=3981 RepID=A0ABQ9MVW3_HEVBR|nr:uncharacterized protein LOC110640342 [Hevea brasiliensis]KAJ9184271.1 hypothetical protein P3X46_004015 [Hevea brasiliensis]
MADLCSLCLLGVMDRLWFHQIILFSESESSTVLFPKTLKQQTPLITESLVHLASSLSLATSPDEEIEEPSITLELNNHKQEEEEEEGKVIVDQKERPTRLNNLRKLQKFMSCRSLGELELEEVKGFMDLGFIFKKEHISPRMISVVPGLVRLGLYKNKHNNKLFNSKVPEDDDIHTEKQEEAEGIIRPYLSEAWLIKRPDSPLLNLRLPRVSAAADMKKHLKFWARTVASVIQQEP